MIGINCPTGAGMQRINDDLSANLLAGNKWTEAENQAAICEINETAPQLLRLYEHMSRNIPSAIKINAPDEIIKNIKNHLRQVGLSKNGWKYLCIYRPNKWLDVIIERCANSLEAFALVVNYACRINVPLDNYPAYVMCVKLRKELGILSAPREQILVNYCQAYVNVMRDTPLSARQGYINQFEYVTKWFVGRILDEYPDDELKSIQSNKAWGYFCREAELDGLRNHDYPPYLVGSWESLVKKRLCYGLDVIPLESAIDLWIEGINMGHCARIYTDNCRSGVSRIFSIRDDGEVLATFELVYQCGAWCLFQIQSYNNRRAGKLENAIAKYICKLYQHYWEMRKSCNIVSAD